MRPIKRGNKPSLALLLASQPAKQAIATARSPLELLRHLEVTPIFQTLIGEHATQNASEGASYADDPAEIG